MSKSLKLSRKLEKRKKPTSSKERSLNDNLREVE